MENKEVIEFYVSVINLYKDKINEAETKEHNMFELVMEFCEYLDENKRKEFLEKIIKNKSTSKTDFINNKKDFMNIFTSNEFLNVYFLHLYYYLFLFILLLIINLKSTARLF